MLVGRASGHCRHSSIEHPAVAGYDDTIDVSDERWRRTWTEVRWNGVLSDDIKSGVVERMISLAATTTLRLKIFFQKFTKPHRHRVHSVEEGLVYAVIRVHCSVEHNFYDFVRGRSGPPVYI